MATIKGWKSASRAERAARYCGGKVVSQDAGDGTMRHVAVQDGWRARDGALMVYGAGGAGYVASADLYVWQRADRGPTALAIE